MDGVDSLDAWVQTRVEKADSGIKEMIEMPVAVRSTAWGCECPDYYIGVGTNVKEGPWIYPSGAVHLPPTSRTGVALWVKGYFTGKIITVDFHSSFPELNEMVYQVPEFVVVSFKMNRKGYDVPFPYIVH